MKKSSWTVFDTPGSYEWQPPPRCYKIDVVLRGAGGSGSADNGGGGGAAVECFTIRPADLDVPVPLVVGAGGTAGGDGQDTTFGALVARGGAGGLNGGEGGLSAIRGGRGGLLNQNGASATSDVIRMLAGGGGGAGRNGVGGRSGPFVGPGQSPMVLWQTLHSGGGGNPNQPGGFPAGGGGAGWGSGAHGCMTIVEYTFGDDEN
ncbi:glycine-rich domain-containing protein [Rhodococcus qingshengii]|uniref:glycine-rich domain-containing protein n=1 Tax=Rhodococcus qingshengii TaxID=334542 RepID=UPI002AFFE443|nr:hypothetical protein [Rhodococcus qingshengii]MEA1795102.1 hypothetical protein [Rhodococcus qingshengii]